MNIPLRQSTHLVISDVTVHERFTALKEKISRNLKTYFLYTVKTDQRVQESGKNRKLFASINIFSKNMCIILLDLFVEARDIQKSLSLLNRKYFQLFFFQITFFTVN